MADPCQHKGEHVLLVEGKDDCHAILALCGIKGIPETFGIFDCGSDLAVLKRANALPMTTPMPTVIGIVLDADVRGWMPAGIKFEASSKTTDTPSLAPPTPHPDNPGKPRLGIWLMPNNTDPGMLKDFLMEMADAESLAHARQSTLEAREKGAACYQPKDESKAIIHTCLAWQDKPGKPLGQNITAHVLKPRTTTASLFAAWLQILFSPDSSMDSEEKPNGQIPDFR